MIKKLDFYRKQFFPANINGTARFCAVHNNRDYINAFFLLFIFFFSISPSLAGGSSVGNAEQWINITTRMFYGDHDALFSYGPLYWITGGAVAHYSLITKFISDIFLVFINAFFWSIIYTLISKNKMYLFFFIVYFAFFKRFIFLPSLFLWPLSIVFYLEFSDVDSKITRKSIVFLFGVLTGLFFYIRFFYGLTAFIIFFSYFLSSFFVHKNKSELLSLCAGAFLGYILFGFIIFHDASSIINYIIINRELSFANSIEMVSGAQETYLPLAFVFIICLILNVFVFFQTKKLLLTTNLLLLILIKLGLSRNDHFFAYFVCPVACISLMTLFKKRRIGIPFFCVIFLALYCVSTTPLYPNGPVINFFDFLVHDDSDYKARVQNVYPEYKLKEIEKIVKKSTIDAYPNCNEYMLANGFNYKNRPLFQSYMTLTPKIDNLNRLYFESTNRPHFILWSTAFPCDLTACNPFIDVDGKYLLNEDPLTSTSILLNYHPVLQSYGKNKSPVVLFQENNTYTKYTADLLLEQEMTFGQWYNVPKSSYNITKVIPNFKFTALGILKNYLFHGEIVNIYYKIDSGAVYKFRLNILNSSSGVWASPFLDKLDFLGRRVVAIKFEIDIKNYIKQRFSAKWIGISANLVNTKDICHEDNPVFCTKSIQPCSVKIDSINGIPLEIFNNQIMSDIPLEINGSLGFQPVKGQKTIKTFITLTRNNSDTLFFSTNNKSSVNFEKNTSTSFPLAYNFTFLLDQLKFRGHYSIGLARLNGSELVICDQPLIDTYIYDKICDTTDANWTKGISKNGQVILIKNTGKLQEYYTVNNNIRFDNGDIRKITHIYADNDFLRITVDGQALDPKKMGFPHAIAVVK